MSGPTIADLELPRLRDEMTARGWRLGRSLPLLRAIYAHNGIDPLRFGDPVAAWASSLTPSPLRELTRHTSSDGTIKLLLQTPDAQTIECVLMPTDRDGWCSGCVSSQVGCAMGCDFCASTLDGVTRSLTAAEIVGQFLALRALARQTHRRMSTLVFMGMGEPLLNLDHVIPAIRRIADHSMGHFGYKNIQVSTVGIVPAIPQLMDADLRVQLALSLHGGDDATRSRIVPAGKKYTVADTLDAAWQHQNRSGRISNIEYCLLAGVNDSPEQAAQLATALAGRRMHVNLIPHNPIGAGLSGTHYQKPSREALLLFLQTLRDAGVTAHVRRTRGDDTSAACGQLRRNPPTPLTLTGTLLTLAGTPVA
jgi:23S rRNA (adenine2503-C2)-methyltransferase